MFQVIDDKNIPVSEVPGGALWVYPANGLEVTSGQVAIGLNIIQKLLGFFFILVLKGHQRLLTLKVTF